jgi:hypothetical protein
MNFGSIGEYTKKFAGSTEAAGVGVAVGVPVGAGDANDVGESFQVFFLPVWVHLNVLPLTIFLAPTWVHSAPFLTIAASAIVKDPVSIITIKNPTTVFLMSIN